MSIPQGPRTGAFVFLRKLKNAPKAGFLNFKEALIKSTCADLRQKFLLTRKKIAGILADFKIF